MQETWVWTLCWEFSLEKGMATHSSILAWRILWTEEMADCSSWVCKGWTWLSDWLSLTFWKVLGDISWWFWFAFTWWIVMLSIFSCACWPCIYLLHKNRFPEKCACCCFSRVQLCDPMGCSLPGSCVLGYSSGRNIGVGLYSFLQRIFLTQGSNSCLLQLLH